MQESFFYFNKAEFYSKHRQSPCIDALFLTESLETSDATSRNKIGPKTEENDKRCRNEKAMKHFIAWDDAIKIYRFMLRL